MDGSTLLRILQQTNLPLAQPQSQPQQQLDPALLANVTSALMSSASQGSQLPSQPQLSYNAPIGGHVPWQSFTVNGQSAPAAVDITQLLPILQQLTQHPVVSNTPAAPVHSQPPGHGQATGLDRLAGTSPDDEQILLNRMSVRSIKGWNVRQTLEGLHGVNNHTGGSWKDYFLENCDRLFRLVPLNEEEGEQNECSSVKEEPLPPRGRTISRGENPASASRTSKTHARGRSGSRSKPTVQRSCSRERSPSHARPHNRVRFSDTPSRSPTPPPAPDSNAKSARRFTDEEEEYLIKSVKWQASKNPLVSYNELARVMAEKAPNSGRSKDSWRGLLSLKRRNDVDRLLADARDNHKERAQGKGKGATLLGEDAEEEASESEGPDTEDDVQCMGAKGQPITTADYRIAARYIASRADWDPLASNYARWGAFAVRYPQRSDKSWAQLYVNHRANIDALVPKYRKRYTRRKEASSSEPATVILPPFYDTHKRDHGEINDDDEEYRTSGKRPRGSL
ncbi:hypothetical protein DAEQUDRAFT_754855 [Daedalea quercina L-15889]|uniref:Myb-like domain-containing protein n=1 Tax=Daedalea quercina L-15889 TaxID=1314783 RepID=A0A165T1P7_9APHY|nr:hypothetical protein DAEQUDRAFT_754855 [Daedalea quercina L-15889]